MSLHLNQTVTPQAIFIQAGGPDDNNHTETTTATTASTTTSCASKLLSPLMMAVELASFVFTKIMNFLFCCLSSENKGVKAEKQALEGLRAKLDAVGAAGASNEIQKAAYKEGVKALTPEQRAGILAKIIHSMSEKLSADDAQPQFEGWAERALDDLTDVRFKPALDQSFGRVAFSAVPAVRAAIDEMVDALDVKLKA
jgi:hypothetical protein